MDKIVRDIYSDDELELDCSGLVTYGEPEHILTNRERYERACKTYEKWGIPLPERYRMLLCD